MAKDENKNNSSLKIENKIFLKKIESYIISKLEIFIITPKFFIFLIGFLLVLSIGSFVSILITSSGLSLDLSQSGWVNFFTIFNIPIKIFAALIVVIGLELTMKRIQQTQEQLDKMSDSLKYQNKQNFENSFFKLLNFHYKILSEIKVSGINPEEEMLAKQSNAIIGKEIYIGRESIEYFYSCFRYQCRIKSSWGKLPFIIQNEWELIYKAYGLYFGHYFRNLYHLFKFIDSSDIDNKKFYAKIVRAQLSKYELLLLFYNCLSNYGNDKFKPLVEKYGLLKLLDEKELIDLNHKSFYKKEAFEKDKNLIS